MKRFFLITALLFALQARAQEKVPTGWSFLPLPNLGFTTDTGLMLGVMGDIFYYGDGSAYPNFLHHGVLAAGYATKGSWYLHGAFESNSLIEGIRLEAAVTYRNAHVSPFYGYNGIASPYDASLDMNTATRTAWYTNHRRFFRFSASALGRIGEHLDWLGGLVVRSVNISDHSLDKYDAGKSLFVKYRELGLIRDDEVPGGTSAEFKAGLKWDSRDVERSPSKGIHAEVYLLSNTDIGRWKYNYGQLAAHFRHYIGLIPERLVFAYHLAFQHQLWGEIPFYNLNEIATLSYPYEEVDGLGSRSTVRGIRYNRVAAAGYAWANIELRATPFRFNLFGARIDLVLNPFTDLAAITRPYRLEEQKQHPDYYRDSRLPVMVCLGMGGKIIINTNFMFSADIGRGLNDQVGAWTVGMASVYVF